MRTITYILFASTFLLFQNILEAQTLKRKGLLGIMMVTLNDSIAKQQDININEGVYLSTVMPNSTFSNANAKTGDVLLKINDTKVYTIQDVLAITSQLYENDNLKLEFYSKGKIHKTSTKLKGRPLEQFKNGDVTYGEVVYRDNILRSILVTPKHKKKSPVIYFLQGYTCGSVETLSDDNPMKKLMNDWVNAGFAVYRIEKPGVGDSQSKYHCSDIDFDTEIQAFKEGYKDLLKQEAIDNTNIFMFGHSMGGVTAPLLNDMHAPKGIITYGTVGKNWYDYMVDLYTIQPKHFGVPISEIKENNKVDLKFNKDLLINKLSGAKMLENKDYVAFFNAEDLKREQYIGRHFKYWQRLANVNIPKVWSTVKTNVLAMHGEFDIQAINKKGAEKLIEIVNNHGGKGTFIVIKNADHGFINFDSMHHNVETLGNGTYRSHAQQNYNTQIAMESIRWMHSKMNN